MLEEVSIAKLATYGGQPQCLYDLLTFARPIFCFGARLGGASPIIRRGVIASITRPETT